jgi:hypothetical protein
MTLIFDMEHVEGEGEGEWATALAGDERDRV